MNKTISINPDLFKLSSDKKTRKKAPTKPNKGEIKIRQPSSGKRKQQNLRRNHVLRFIRDQQERKYEGIDIDVRVILFVTYTLTMQQQHVNIQNNVS